MEASSSIYPAQTYCSQSWNYDVFLSFRGEDTRKTFVDHLYTALEHQGIYTYKDDETLPRGNSIRPSLMKAIEESQIAVIILSENYADSSWCLDELECIMKCKNIKGQTVMPIFYDVDPSEVRKQKRKYGEAFARHEVENKTNVESWRKALVDVSNLSGWEPKHIANG
ncbi:TMV resistance protein N-like [Lactuca sativa]|uniref:TMV resistance protein N-like n=1 Tax=Lactuca sativa TaxID=4236 RepID=UPI0022AFDBCC|nr:TMV resistance protein N-like [Lactuca sativa]